MTILGPLEWLLGWNMVSGCFNVFCSCQILLTAVQVKNRHQLLDSKFERMRQFQPNSITILQILAKCEGLGTLLSGICKFLGIWVVILRANFALS